MKVSTLKKRLEKRFKGSKNSIAYKVVSDVLNQTKPTEFTEAKYKLQILQKEELSVTDRTLLAF